MNQSIHAIDLLQWYMGPVDSVCARARHPGARAHRSGGHGSGSPALQSGALGVIEGTTAASPSACESV